MQGMQDYAALKLDIFKAYNRLEWKYLEAVLHKMGSTLAGVL